MTNVDLDSIVSIDHGSVSIYEDSAQVPKPPVGTKLNKPAVVRFERIFSPSGVSKNAFAEELERSLHTVGASAVRVPPPSRPCRTAFACYSLVCRDILRYGLHYDKSMYCRSLRSLLHARIFMFAART